MPLYAYTCPECGHRFEKLVSLARRDEPMVCETCGHQQVGRSIDSFRSALGSGSSSSSSGGYAGGSCGGGGGFT